MILSCLRMHPVRVPDVFVCIAQSPANYRYRRSDTKPEQQQATNPLVSRCVMTASHRFAFAMDVVKGSSAIGRVLRL